MKPTVLLLLAVFVIFAAVVGLGIAFGGPDRVLGGVLLLLGVVVILFSRVLSQAKASVGERLPLWPGRNRVRPLTMVLWGSGLVLIGLLQMVGL